MLLNRQFNAFACSGVLASEAILYLNSSKTPAYMFLAAEIALLVFPGTSRLIKKSSTPSWMELTALFRISSIMNFAAFVGVRFLFVDIAASLFGAYFWTTFASGLCITYTKRGQVEWRGPRPLGGGFRVRRTAAGVFCLTVRSGPKPPLGCVG